MNKIIIVISLLLTSILNAQGVARDVNTFGKMYLDTKALEDSLKKAQEQAQLDALKKQKAQEEKVLKIKKEAEPICTKITDKEESKFICILKAIFLGGRFPGETDEQYKLRLQVSTLPATQPYK